MISRVDPMGHCIESVGKYIEKYYVPGNDDIELDDANIKDFFDKITGFLSNKKESSADEKKRSNRNMQIIQKEKSPILKIC